MTPLLTIDEASERSSAGDGTSRLAAYLRQHAHLFVDDWEPLSPAAHAATVWSVATAPVMAPPYVRVSPAVWGIDCRHGDEPGILVVSLDVRIRWPHDHRDDAALRGWSDWCPTPCWDSSLYQLTEPGDDRPAALFTARLRLPIAEHLLPAPAPFAAVDVLVAKCAIATIADQVNVIAGPVVSALRALDKAEAAR